MVASCPPNVAPPNLESNGWCAFREEDEEGSVTKEDGGLKDGEVGRDRSGEGVEKIEKVKTDLLDSLR